MIFCKTVLVTIFGTLLVSLAGCGGGSGSASVPSVLYSSRSDGAQDAAVNTDILAVMSEALDPDSVGGSSLTVMDDTSHHAVLGTVEYDASRAALIFHEAGNLTGGHLYTATVANSVRNLSGTPMAQSYSWSFTVDGSRSDSPEQLSIQQILDKAAYAYQIPGSIIAIRDDHGNTWSTTNGYADRVAKTPITTDMYFRMGSNTKTFVATEILRLVDAGTIGLDDPIKNYLSTEIAAHMPTYATRTEYINGQLTIRHLLQHTSGINNFTTDPVWGDAFVNDPTKQYTPEELLEIADSHANDPGAPTFNTFLYSNTNYVLLGLLIKNVSGVRYEDAIAANLTTPQGLTHTKVPEIGDPTMPVPYSHGYYEDSTTGEFMDVSIKDPSTVWSSGDMITTIGDLAKWGELIGNGALLNPATQTARLTYVTMDDHLQYGLGIVKDNSANLIGHQGGMIGYTSQMYYLPDKGYTLAFFYNRTLALHDYSDVMTYDAIKVLWPTRTAAYTVVVSPQVVVSPAGAVAGGMPKWKPGFLTEY